MRVAARAFAVFHGLLEGWFTALMKDERRRKRRILGLFSSSYLHSRCFLRFWIRNVISGPGREPHRRVMVPLLSECLFHSGFIQSK